MQSLSTSAVPNSPQDKDFKMTEAIVVYVTCPPDDADKLAETLVEEGLVACVNIVPSVRSVYMWQGSVAKDQESLLVMKTSSAIYDRLEARVKQLHSYQLPEVIAMSIEHGSQKYLDWLLGSLKDKTGK